MFTPPDPASRPPELTGRQRRWLRARANPLDALVHVGQSGLSDAVVRATRDALADHELVKVRLHEPEDKKGLAREIADATGAALCGLVGHTVILYRPHPERPRLVLPARELG